MIQGTEQQDIYLASRAKTLSRAPIIIALAIGVVALIVTLVRLGPNAAVVLPKKQVQIATVIRGDLVRDLAVQGKVVASKAPTLFSQVEGLINFIKQPGEAVAVGDLLAVIESPELENLVKQHKLLLAGMKAEMERTQLVAREQKLDTEQLRDSAKVNLQTAKRDLNRAEQSIALGVIRKIDYETAKDNMDKAEMEYSHMNKKLALVIDKLAFEHRAAEQALARQQLVVNDLEAKQAALQIKAPVTGQVGNWLVPQQSRVVTGSSLLTVIDLGQYEAEIFVSENYAGDLRPGLAVEVTLNGAMIMGQLRHIAPEVKDGNVTARVAFNQNDAQSLRQNQRVSARVLIEEKRNVLRVARGDFISSGGGQSVYKLEQNIAVRVPVQLGALSVQWVELVKGVSEGDQLVVSNVQAFKNAERVRLN